MHNIFSHNFLIIILFFLPKMNIKKRGGIWLKKYKLEHFNIEQDIGIVLIEQSGKPKLYLFMAKPEEDNIIIDKSNLL